MVTAYKCTRANARDFKSNTVQYEAGATLEVADAPKDGEPCGVGLHVSPTARMTCRYGNRDIDRGAWRWFEIQYDEADVCGRDDTKVRVRKLVVVRELTVVDVFGASLAEQVERQRAEVATWKDIPWLKPSRAVGEDDLRPLMAQLHEATTFWLAKRGINRALPRAARIITDRQGAIDAADQARHEYSVADVAAVAAAADGVADVAAAADDVAAVAAVAAAAAADAVDGGGDFRPSWLWWYLRPCYVLWRHSRFILGGMTEPNPFAPLVAMYRLGVLPLGWSGGQFCIYVPPAVASTKEAA